MLDRENGMVQSYGYPSTATATTTNNSNHSQVVTRAVAAAAANNHHSNRSKAGRGSKRYSVSAFYSMAAEQDNEVEDDLAQGKVTCPAWSTTVNSLFLLYSTTSATRAQVKDIWAIEKELCVGTGRTLPWFSYSFVDSEPHCFGWGKK